MKLKKMVTSCISKPKKIKEKYSVLDQRQKVEPNIYYWSGYENQEEELSNYSELVKKIQQGEITLEVLDNLRKLKVDDKKSFLADIKDMVSNNRLHELNVKIMEHALDLVDSQDSAFLLRRTKEDSIFRDLIYLEAKGNKFTVDIDKKGNLTITFSSMVLELYKLLINNFYLEKFRDDEFRKKAYELYKEDLKKLGDTSEEALENYYVKNSLAQSIMCLFVSRDIRERAVSEELLKLDIFKKVFEGKKALYGASADSKLLVVDYVLNDVKGVYINNLVASNILDLVMYSQSNNETIESIEILGNSESLV
ncbi:DUF5410 family protein [Rickettsia oklahomensis]|uniref:DUF5410 family protein n=1 Tax=Rickettsia oklahomensis TaxID=3141789 RepID=A0AAU7BYK1_9RICK